jgi:hypothetical protein
VGFADLGFDVYYVEDTRLWPVFQNEGANPADCSASVEHLATVMNAFNLGDRWAYRDEASGCCFGMSERQVKDICQSADIFVNVSCSTFVRDEYLSIPIRILIDSDPMFTQIQYMNNASITPCESGPRSMIDAHTHHFTFGENVGDDDCQIPYCGIKWRPTRQPICLQYWIQSAVPESSSAYTTVMNWSAAPPLEYLGQQWGQKNVEFERLMTLPQLASGIPLAVAVGQTTGAEFPAESAGTFGWRLLDPNGCAADWESYRRFIFNSRGEFSVAKETYVKARTGWFSGRSACYLAAGRPVVTQDTGWTKFLPHDLGLLGFVDLQSAADALAQVEAEPQRHAKHARQIAEQYFDSGRVLSQMMAELED